MTDPMRGEQPVIELSGIRKVYGGAVPVSALDGISLRVGAGELVAVMGPSGSGKSTLMNLLGLLDRPTEGTYRFAGEEVHRLSDVRLAAVRRERIGFVFQSFNLFPRKSALDNVALPLTYAGVPRRERRRRAEAMLQRVGLGGRAQHRPKALSGGEQQRVAIARALINDPAVILADEPTGNLDSRTGDDVLVLLQALNDRGVTLLMVTHDDRVAHHAGRIVRVADGRLVADERVDSPLRATGGGAH